MVKRKANSHMDMSVELESTELGESSVEVPV